MELKDVYREALKLHRMSWERRLQGGAKYFWQKDTFEDSHLPKNYNNECHWDFINQIIETSATYDHYENGKFVVYLDYEDALILLLKPNYDNIHYIRNPDIDLENYKIAANTYNIKIDND